MGIEPMTSRSTMEREEGGCADNRQAMRASGVLYSAPLDECERHKQTLYSHCRCGSPSPSQLQTISQRKVHPLHYKCLRQSSTRHLSREPQQHTNFFWKQKRKYPKIQSHPSRPNLNTHSRKEEDYEPNHNVSSHYSRPVVFPGVCRPSNTTSLQQQPVRKPPCAREPEHSRIGCTLSMISTRPMPSSHSLPQIW